MDKPLSELPCPSYHVAATSSMVAAFRAVKLVQDSIKFPHCMQIHGDSLECSDSNVLALEACS